MSLERQEHDTVADEDVILEVDGLKKYFDTSDGFVDRLIGGGLVRAVDGVDLDVRSGETLGIVGESGCGKSTLGHTILNLEKPTEGSVRYRGEEVAGLSHRDMRPYRSEMQMVFQDPLASLNPRQTVGSIITAPMEVHDIGESDADRRDRAEDLLERVGLKSGHIDRYPHQFSGGQQQRVAIARALSVDPDLIIADEPVSALDVSVQAQILNLLDEIQDDLGLAMVFIAHDLSVIENFTDRVAVMYLGEIVEKAPVDDIFDNPQHPYTQSLLSSVPRIDPGDREDRIVLKGTVPSPLDPPSACRFHTRCPVVIPPDDWPADQETFKSAFAFRNRVLAGELDPDAARKRLSAKEETVDDEEIAEYFVDSTISVDHSRIPDDTADVIKQAAEAIVAQDNERAEKLVREALPSPCEQKTPKPVDVSEDHTASCHRVDPDHPREPIWPN